MLRQFTSADTVADGLNRYGYVYGNPTTFTDPSGHVTDELSNEGGGAPGGGGGAYVEVDGVVTMNSDAVFSENTFVATPDGGEIETTISGDTFTFDAEGNITEIDGISTVGDNAPSTVTNEGDVRELQQENAGFSKGTNGNGNGSGRTPEQAASGGTANAYGPAHVNNPQEYQQIMDDLQTSGVEVNLSTTTPPGQGQYGPSSTPGQPGSLRVNPDVDISTLGHEYEHFLMDRELGYPGARTYWEDPELRMQGEARAYDTEIARAEAAGYSELSQMLEDAKQACLAGLRAS